MIRIKINGIDAALRANNKRVVEKAIVSALNKTIAQGATAAKKEIRAEYNIKAKDVTNALKVKRASISMLRAELNAFGSRLRLYLFGARWKRRQAGATVMIRKGQRKTIAHSFIARMRSGHIGLFERMPDKFMASKGGDWSGGIRRQAIRELTTIDASMMLAAKNVMEKVVATINSKWDAVFAHELDYYKSKAR